MTRKLFAAFAVILTLACSAPPAVYANMAAPDTAEIGSSVTFEKNEAIAVLSEVLDITVSGPQANISAVYRMKNTTDSRVSTRSMFLAPDMETGGAGVTVSGRATPFTAKNTP